MMQIEFTYQAYPLIYPTINLSGDSLEKSIFRPPNPEVIAGVLGEIELISNLLKAT